MRIKPGQYRSESFSLIIERNKCNFFSPLWTGDLFHPKESVLKYLTSVTFYRFACPDCNVSYIADKIIASWQQGLNGNWFKVWHGLKKEIKHVSTFIIFKQRFVKVSYICVSSVVTWHYFHSCFLITCCCKWILRVYDT